MGSLKVGGHPFLLRHSLCLQCAMAVTPRSSGAPPIPPTAQVISPWTARLPLAGFHPNGGARQPPAVWPHQTHTSFRSNTTAAQGLATGIGSELVYIHRLL